MNDHVFGAGFTDAVAQSQAVFHSAMMALARPGLPQRVDASLKPPAPLTPGAAALALALCDFETTLWLDASLASEEVIAYLRFHTGTRLVADPAEAQFALIGAPATLTDFGDFANGTLDYPDRSTTLILAVDTIETGAGLRLTGPGIDGETHFRAAPLPADFGARCRANRALFPRGIDMLFVAGDMLAGLPRSTRVEG